MSDVLLRIEDLSVDIGGVRIVEDVSLALRAGEALGLVGESGCGKTLTALAAMGLLPPQARVAGRILYDGEDLTQATRERLEQLRGDRIAMIFQEPMTALNPVFSIGDQIRESLTLHRGLSRRAADARAIELLERVGLPAPAAQLTRYPHQLSGGQRQRVLIAIALACEPRLLIADEPTTALDVTIQAQILELIEKLRREMGMALLMVTHDLGVVSEVCDRVAVMYAGRIVEEAPAGRLFAQPRHRYAQALIATAPASNPRGAALPVIAGQVPPPGARGPGCAFAPRCGFALPDCAAALPPMRGEAHRAACWNPPA
ncbi:MAG: ABC transporter ATP-binding protein [Methylobacteriaceae bacterium]|nr:ABC transporter ATP-binding protein [Methylobacteriaceae bacterium]